MSAWSGLRKSTPDALIIFAVQYLDTAAEAAAAACGGKGNGVLLLLDPGGRTARRFNAHWLPRGYALDERGRVTYVQPAFTADSQIPAASLRSWQGVR
jgi:hypothetical protein